MEPARVGPVPFPPNSEMTRIEQPVIDPFVERKLAGLRAALRAVVALRGAAWVLVALAATVAATLIVDYGLHRLTLKHMTVAQRLVPLGLCLAGVAEAAWRLLLAPLLAPLAGEELALVVERAHPELGDRLISALQFRRGDGGARGTSGELAARVAVQLNEQARALRFADAVDGRPARRHALLALAAAGVVALLWLLMPALMRSWFRRNVLLADVPYPKRTELWVEHAGRLRVVRGGTLDVVVRADPNLAVPDAVTFHMRFASAGALEEDVPPAPDEPAKFAKRFKGVNEPFTFHVTGNDARSEELSVDVAEPPQLADVAFQVAPPDYTRLPPVGVARAQGTLQVPEQSWVTVTAAATKPLRAARMFLDGAEAGTCRVTGPDSPPAASAVWGRFQLLPAKPFRPSMALWFELTDSEGFVNPRAAQYNIAVVPDKPPVLQIETAGVGGQVTGKARIPLRVSARDDYGLGAVELVWSIQSLGGKGHRQLVRDFEGREKSPPALEHVFDLLRRDPNAPDGAPELDRGETLHLQAEARDALPPPAGPNRAVSNLITLKVVSEEELLVALLDSQRALRDQFERAIELQKDVQLKTGSAAERAVQAGGLNEARRMTASVGDQQQQVLDLVGEVAGRLAGILERMRNNRVAAEADMQRLDRRIIAPLKALTGGAMREAIAGLVAARDVSQPLPLAAELRRLAGLEGQVLRQLEAVLAEMVKVESAQEVERRLRMVIKISRDVRDAAKGVPATRPATAPAPE